MIPYWPADLPQRLIVEGFSQGLAEGRLRTAMETGPPKSRRRFSAAVRPVSAQFYGHSNAFARLERFWADDTAGGSLPFLMPDQTRDALRLEADGDGPLLNDDGQPLINTSWWLALFGESPPQLGGLSGRLYRISVSFTVLP